MHHYSALTRKTWGHFSSWREVNTRVPYLLWKLALEASSLTLMAFVSVKVIFTFLLTFELWSIEKAQNCGENEVLSIFTTCFHVNLTLHRWWKDVSRSRRQFYSSFRGIFSSASSTLICHFTSQKLLNILNVKLVIVSGKQSCLSTQDTLKSQQGSKGGSRSSLLVRCAYLKVEPSRAVSSHFSDGWKPR